MDWINSFYPSKRWSAYRSRDYIDACGVIRNRKYEVSTSIVIHPSGLWHQLSALYEGRFCGVWCIGSHQDRITEFFPPAYAEQIMFSYCACECVSECVCVCLHGPAITFEVTNIETSFLVWWYTLTISRLIVNIKVTGLRSRATQWKC